MYTVEHISVQSDFFEYLCFLFLFAELFIETRNLYFVAVVYVFDLLFVISFLVFKLILELSHLFKGLSKMAFRILTSK